MTGITAGERSIGARSGAIREIVPPDAPGPPWHDGSRRGGPAPGRPRAESEDPLVSKRTTRHAPHRSGGADAFRAALGARLEERGLRHSGVRDLVVEAFLEARGHVSVEDLTRLARRRDAGIGQATVYRTLKLLAEVGLAAARDFGDGVTRYEPVLEHRHHDHLICTRCGRIVEFENGQIEALQLAVARRHGFAVESHKLELYGQCAQCRRDGAAPSRAG